MLDDHLRLIVEADGQPALTRGMRGLGIRLAARLRSIFGLEHMRAADLDVSERGRAASVGIHIPRTATEALKRTLEQLHERARSLPCWSARRRAWFHHRRDWMCRRAMGRSVGLQQRRWAVRGIAIIQRRGRYGERRDSSPSV